jgi:Cysteine-rich CWC
MPDAKKERESNVKLMVTETQCPRCKSRFTCNAANIERCQCWGVGLEAQDFAYLRQLGFSAQETDCLCRNCLVDIKKQVKNSSS